MFLLAWADFTYEQLAEALDVPVGTVRSRVSRVRSKLSAHLTRPDANAEAAEASGEWVGMNELDRLRRAYDAIDAPSEVAVATARELLRSEIEGANPVGNGLPRHEPPERRRAHRRRGRALVALAAAILVGGLLVTPALGIGSRLLDLIQGPPAPPEVQTPVWSPDGGGSLSEPARRQLGALRHERRRERAAEADARREDSPLLPGRPTGGRSPSRRGRDGTDGIYVMNADGSGQRRLTRQLGDGAPAWSPDGRKIAFCSVRRQREVYVMNADGSGQRRLTREARLAASSSCLVARRAEDRLPAVTRALRPGLLRDLRHERRRERAAEPDAKLVRSGLLRSCLVARRAEDRLRRATRRQRRGLRHERRRQRAAEPDAQPGAATALLPGRPTGGRSPSSATATATPRSTS